MKRIHPSGVALACAALLTLAACGEKSDNTTAGQKLDSAVAQTSEAAAKARIEAEAAMEDAKAAVQDGSDKVAAKVDDAMITAQVNAGLAKDPDLSALKINVDTTEGKVTLTGLAPTTEARDRAGLIARTVKGVSTVSNQLVVKAG